MSNKIKGWCVLTETISGPELVWNTIDTTGEEDVIMPEVFDTEKDAYKEIASDLITDLQQFMENEREWDEIRWPEDEYHVARILIDNGQIEVWDDGVSEDMRHMILETSLKEWQESL
jgi:hypothetical protein